MLSVAPSQQNFEEKSSSWERDLQMWLLGNSSRIIKTSSSWSTSSVHSIIVVVTRIFFLKHTKKNRKKKRLKKVKLVVFSLNWQIDLFCLPNTDHVTIPRKVFPFKVGHSLYRTQFFQWTRQRFKPPWYSHMICIAKTKSTSGQFREYESRGRKQTTRPLAEKKSYSLSFSFSD